MSVIGYITVILITAWFMLLACINLTPRFRNFYRFFYCASMAVFGFLLLEYLP